MKTFSKLGLAGAIFTLYVMIGRLVLLLTLEGIELVDFYKSTFVMVVLLFLFVAAE